MTKAQQYERYTSKGLAPARQRTGLVYLLVGGGVGGVLALLFAPKPGADLRHDISDRSAGLFSTVKEKTDRVYDLGENISGAMDDSQRLTLTRRSGGRKASSIV